MKSDQLYVHDIVASIVKIETYTKTGRGAFFNSPLIQDAVIRNFEIIGEATKGLSMNSRAHYPESLGRVSPAFETS